MKRCTKCGEEKPLDMFFRRAGSRDGKVSACKLCIAAKKQAVREADPEGHREKARLQSEKWRAANPDAAKQSWATRNKRWKESNPEGVRLSKRTRDQRMRFAHGDLLRQRVASWRRSNPEKVRATVAVRRALTYTTKIEPVSLLDLIQRDGTACYICRLEVDPAAPARAPNKAELEHIVPLSRGGTHTRDNLRVACGRCNRIKGAHRTPEETRALVCA